MDLLKLRIMDTYLFKPKWPERNTGKAHLEGGMPPKGYFDVRRSRGS
jgi:hypothetical protein